MTSEKIENWGEKKTFIERNLKIIFLAVFVLFLAVFILLVSPSSASAAGCVPVCYEMFAGSCSSPVVTRSHQCRAESGSCLEGAACCGCGWWWQAAVNHDTGCLATGPDGCKGIIDCNSWTMQDKFPDTDNYNGSLCKIISPVGLAWSCVGNGEGVWDASEKKCVQCEGNFEKKICGNTTTLYLGCSQEVATTCEAACPSYSGSQKCDDKIPASESNPGDPCGYNNTGTCDANCQCIGEAPPCSWKDDGCDMGCNERDMHQTCVPPGCSDGECTTGETRCVPNHPSCIPCEENCTCPCPEVCKCPLGDCVGEYEKLKGGLVPCGRMCNDPCTKECECCPCTLCHLFVLFKKIVDFITIDVLFPLAVLMIVVGGVMFLTAAGDPGRIGNAKKMLTATVIGLLIIFLAWLIVDTIIMFLTPAGSPFQNWSTINCPICGDGTCDPGETPENCLADCGAPPPPPGCPPCIICP